LIKNFVTAAIQLQEGKTAKLQLVIKNKVGGPNRHIRNHNILFLNIILN